jgi:hypothetical protein
MPFKGHAIVSKKILSRDAERWLICCWDTCDHDAYEMYKSLFHDHPKGMGCNHPQATHLWYTFCSERHLRYFVNSHRDYGNENPRHLEGSTAR